ncbi:MAG: hypothetical protein GF401_02335 [Chitinivibrionales bacterium]|nr:hypothetical protein [Chitinivibrionales bacterium]
MVKISVRPVQCQANKEPFMGLENAIGEECIVVHPSGGDKERALRQVVEAAKHSEVLRDINNEDIYQRLQRREELGSTGFGNGIAIPHCTFESIDEFVVGIIISSEGFDFASVDGKPVHILVFIIGPRSRRNEHIHLLSGISRALNSEHAVEELLQLTDPAKIRKTFIQHSEPETGGIRKIEWSMVQVFVQDEGKFEDILQVFSEIAECSISVVEARDAGQYLNNVPLFAAFLDDKDQGYHRIINAIVLRSMVNDTLRRLSDLIGDLQKSPGIMIAVQDLVYCIGSLNF